MFAWALLVVERAEPSDDLPEEIWGTVENCEDDKLGELCKVYCELHLSQTINIVQVEENEPDIPRSGTP
jgi:hypothetical protein